MGFGTARGAGHAGGRLFGKGGGSPRTPRATAARGRVGAGRVVRWRSSREKGAGGGATQVRSDINVTPLVDVVLVLLIIFMVVTPMLSKGVNVDLPITQHHDKRNDDNRDIIVAITRAGDVYVGQERVPLDAVEQAIATQRRRYPDKALFLKGDARVDFGHARRVMEALHRAGADQVQLGTEEAGEASSP